MVDKKLAKKSEAMRKMAGVKGEAAIEKEEEPVIIKEEKKYEGVRKSIKKPGVARKSEKKLAKVLSGG